MSILFLLASLPWLLSQNYYGNVLRTSADLQTNACVTPAKLVPKYIRERLQNVHEAVTSRYYGCGLVVPERLESCWILDLGSGSGRDCYVLSQLVGEKGHVTGIDMTEVQGFEKLASGCFHFCFR